MHRKLFAFLACMGLAFLIATPLQSQAASAWSFQCRDELIEKDGTTTMSYQQYKNFDLLKNYRIISDETDDFDDYTVLWESSNEDAVWINKFSGQARANKFDRFTEDFATVKISAHITNTKTGKQIVRSFTVELDNLAFTQGAENTPASETSAMRTINMDLASLEEGDNLEERVGKISLEQNDSEGFFVREIPFTKVNDRLQDEKATGVDEFTVVITKGDAALDDSDKVKKAPEIKKVLCTETVGHNCNAPGIYKVIVNPFFVAADGEITKADTGTYKVRLYKGDGTEAKLVSLQNIVIKDTTPAITVSKVNEQIEGFATMAQLTEAIKFYFNGTELNAEKLAANVTLRNADVDYMTDDTNRVYIYSIDIDLPVSVYNDEWNDPNGTYTKETIIIDKTFTLK